MLRSLFYKECMESIKVGDLVEVLNQQWDAPLGVYLVYATCSEVRFLSEDQFYIFSDKYHYYNFVERSQIKKIL